MLGRNPQFGAGEAEFEPAQERREPPARRAIEIAWPEAGSGGIEHDGAKPGARGPLDHPPGRVRRRHTEGRERKIKGGPEHWADTVLDNAHMAHLAHLDDVFAGFNHRLCIRFILQ